MEKCGSNWTRFATRSGVAGSRRLWRRRRAPGMNDLRPDFLYEAMRLVSMPPVAFSKAEQTGMADFDESVSQIGLFCFARRAGTAHETDRLVSPVCAERPHIQSCIDRGIWCDVSVVGNYGHLCGPVLFPYAAD